MLKNFSVANFRSIKEPVSLSCIKEKGEEMANSLIPFKNQFILPELMILGPNGSGKSNLIKAISVSKAILSTSSARTEETIIPGIQPYDFDLESQTAPVEFEYELTIENDTYIYGFAATEKEIIKEYLYRYKTNRPSLIFERNQEHYEFTKKNEGYYSQYLKRNSKNKLFLSTAATWEDSLCKKVYNAIVYKIEVYHQEELVEIGKILIKGMKDPHVKAQLLQDLTMADMSLKNIDLNEEEIDPKDNPQFPLNLEIMKSIFNIDKNFKAFRETSTVTHVVNGQEKVLPLELESEGTKRFIYLIHMIRRALNMGSTLVVDELENCLHPLLVKQIMNLFMDPEENSNYAQLIFTTHSAWMMDMRRLRRDQIVFVDKKRDDLSTEVFKLSDFNPRKDTNYLTNYFQGRYGAIPRLLDE